MNNHVFLFPVLPSPIDSNNIETIRRTAPETLKTVSSIGKKGNEMTASYNGLNALVTFAIENLKYLSASYNKIVPINPNNIDDSMI